MGLRVQTCCPIFAERRHSGPDLVQPGPIELDAMTWAFRGDGAPVLDAEWRSYVAVQPEAMRLKE